MKKLRPRFQEIKYNSEGECFVTYYGRKHFLNEFMSCNFFHKGFKIEGMKTISNSYGLGIIINNSNDAAKIISIS